MSAAVSREAVLFDSITVVTPNEAGGIDVLPGWFVAVAEGEIKAVTSDRAVARQKLPADFHTYSGRNRILLPAFANAHGHLPMTLLRNSADDLPLHEWLFDHIFPRESKLRPQDVAVGSQLAMLEMIRGGTACAADMYYYAEETAEAALAAGFRLNLCCEGKTEDASGRAIVVSEPAEAFCKRYVGAGEGLLNVSLLVHSIYLYEEEIYPRLAELAERLDIGIQVHVSETRKEVEDCLAAYQMRPVAKLAALGIFDRPTLAAHCVWLDEEDRRILKTHKVSCVHNPVSNLKLASGMADLPAMLQDGLMVCLGTDGAASNNRLDLFQEMRLAALLAKGRSLDPTVVDAATVLRMATVNGYHSMGFSNCGLIREGMRADLQIIRTDDVNNRPCQTDERSLSVPSLLVYSAGPENVESVLCDGRFLLYKNDFVSLDRERILADAELSAIHLG